MTQQKASIWDITITEDKPELGLYELQWHLPHLDVMLVAKDLSFADEIIGFIAETRNKPHYRDIPLDDGRYKSAHNELTLDKRFLHTAVCIGKDIKYDSRYYMRIQSGHIWLRCDIWGDDVDQFLKTLQEVIDDYWIQDGGSQKSGGDRNAHALV